MSLIHTHARPGFDDPGHDDAAVQALLDKFATALTTGDARGIARLWETPAFVMSDEGTHAVKSREEVERFFGGANDQYWARGITDTRAEITDLDWLTSRMAMVRVRWPYLDARGQEHGDETSTYLLRRDDHGDLKLLVAVMHGASE